MCLNDALVPNGYRALREKINKLSNDTVGYSLRVVVVVVDHFALFFGPVGDDVVVVADDLSDQLVLLPDRHPVLVLQPLAIQRLDHVQSVAGFLV